MQHASHQSPTGNQQGTSIQNLVNFAQHETGQNAQPQPANQQQPQQHRQQQNVSDGNATAGQHRQQQQTGRVDRSTKDKYSLNDFTLQRTLGTGSFGRVHLVQSTHNHRFYAMKVLKKAQVVKMKQIEHTNDERRMLSRARHPFLITLWGTWQDSRNLYMVMDFVEGGELFSLLRKSQVCLPVCGEEIKPPMADQIMNYYSAFPIPSPSFMRPR